MNSVQKSVSNHLLLFPVFFCMPSAGSLVLNMVGITVFPSPQDMFMGLYSDFGRLFCLPRSILLSWAQTLTNGIHSEFCVEICVQSPALVSRFFPHAFSRVTCSEYGGNHSVSFTPRYVLQANWRQSITIGLPKEYQQQ